MRYEFLNTCTCNFASARLFVGVFGEEGCLNGWGQRHFVSLCLVARRARCVRAYFPETSDIPTLKPAVVFL